MADCGQVLQDKIVTTRVCRAFGVDTPTTPLLTGDEEGEGPLSEYSLHFEISLVPPEGWAGGGDRRWLWVGHRGLVVWSFPTLVTRGLQPHIHSKLTRGDDGALGHIHIYGGNATITWRNGASNARGSCRLVAWYSIVANGKPTKSTHCLALPCSSAHCLDTPVCDPLHCRVYGPSQKRVIRKVGQGMFESRAMKSRRRLTRMKDTPDTLSSN